MTRTTSRTEAWSRHTLGFCYFLLLAPWTSALQIAYCSSDNNADNYPVFTYQYMSNGECHDHCVGSYAFAIIQGQNCWCSNEVPRDTTNTLNCNQPCPGYPYEWCGSTSANLYAYFNVGGTITGTSGGSSTAAPSSSFTPPTSAAPSTVIVASSPAVSSTRESASSTSALSSQTPQVVTSVVTQTGRVSTILVTQSPTSSPKSTSDSALGSATQQNSGGGGLKGGAIAGIVIGVAVIIGSIIGLAVFFILRRRHKRNIETMSAGGYISPSHASKNGNNGVPSRQVSQMSSAGLLSKIPRINTMSALSTDDPRSAAAGSTIDRSSTHMTVDQRLNPWAIYSNEDNRNSNVSLNDANDYSRQLRVANPDPQH